MSLTGTIDDSDKDPIEERIRKNREEALRRLQLKRAKVHDTLSQATEQHDFEVSMTRDGVYGIDKHFSVDHSRSKKQHEGAAGVSKIMGNVNFRQQQQQLHHHEPTSTMRAGKQLVKRIALKFQLLSRKSFEIKCDYHKSLTEYFQKVQGSRYDMETTAWIFPFEQYGSILKNLEEKFSENLIELHSIPKSIVTLLEREQIEENQALYRAHFELSCIGSKLESSLLPFQVEGVHFALQRKGRLLLGDDMGLGKTIQAIAIGAYYRSEWPLLIVTPSSLRVTWYEALFEWLPFLKKGDVNMIMTGRANLSGSIVIISYDLATKYVSELASTRYQVIIADESHYIKTASAKRTKALLPLLKSSPRVILLTGTPALSRPQELYTQIYAINSKLFPRMNEFGLRYCNGKKNYFGWDFSGSSNLTELQLILETSIMIRRMKADVLDQLPVKRRRQVFLHVNDALKKKLEPLLETVHEGDLMNSDASLEDSDKIIEENGRSKMLTELWKESATMKLPAMLEYVSDLLDRGCKFLLFAHHINVLEAFSRFLKERKVEFIRIDGSTPPEQRQYLCHEFQSHDAIRVAVLSLTAASVGLTFTAANTIIFAELYWNPGVLLQAEDRAHRIGQRDSVDVQYLLARNTLDDRIWPMLSRKFDVLQHVGLSRGGFDVSQSVVVPPSNQLVIDKFMTKKTGSDSELLKETQKKQKTNEMPILKELCASIDARLIKNSQETLFMEDDSEGD